MGKIYKGYELMQAIAEGKIEEGSKFLCSTGDTYVYHDNYGLGCLNSRTLVEEDTIESTYCLTIWLNYTFELLEDEIDIQSIEELDMDERIRGMYTKENVEHREKTNLILQWAKQIDKKIKEKE